jgi:hypothetical protein
MGLHYIYIYIKEAGIALSAEQRAGQSGDQMPVGVETGSEANPEFCTTVLRGGKTAGAWC